MQNIREKIRLSRNKILSVFLLLGITVSVAQIARAESIGEFLEGPLPPAAQNNKPSPPAPVVLTADKSAYALSDTIRISNTPPGSAIEIYWLDNPETALNSDPESWPSNVYAILVNDDGTANIDGTSLPAGRFVFVNTFEEEHCGGFYLSQCRARSDYLGEVLLTIAE